MDERGQKDKKESDGLEQKEKKEYKSGRNKNNEESNHRSEGKKNIDKTTLKEKDKLMQ